MRTKMNESNHSARRSPLLEDFITGTLTVDQQKRVESAIDELVIEKVILHDDWCRGFEAMSFCVMRKDCFIRFRNHFSEKLLAIQQAIRNQGLDALWNEVSPKIERLAA